MLGPQSTSFCCHWLCRHEAKCGGAYQKTPEPTACTGTQKHCPKSPGRNDFAAQGEFDFGPTHWVSVFFLCFVCPYAYHPVGHLL